MQGKRFGVLFVCHGNICRSPAAEGAFLHAVRELSLSHAFLIDSCGTSREHIGDTPHPLTIQIARNRKIHLDSKARQFHRKDFDQFDYILAMDQMNHYNLKALAESNEEKEKILLFRQFDPLVDKNQKPPDVPDPYYGGKASFQEVQEIAERSGKGLLDWLRKKHNL